MSGLSVESEGCDCTELCEMGPTCPGGMLASLPGSGCGRLTYPDVTWEGLTHEQFLNLIDAIAVWMETAKRAMWRVEELAAREAEARRDERRKVAEELPEWLLANGMDPQSVGFVRANLIARAHLDPADARDDKEGR